MSAKNFISYGDAETVFTGFANAIKDNKDAISAMKDGSELDSFGDVEVALLDKADTSDLGTAAAKDSTNAVTAGSTDLVESGAVKDAIDAAVSSAYHHAGTKTVAQLTHDLLIAANEGNVYNITDSGTTTSDFIEGIGKQINAGDNVGICKVRNEYMFDLLSGLEDTSIFVQKSQTSGLLKNDGTVNTTIEDTVAGHTTALATKQNATDNDLQTTDKTVVGGINEVNSNILQIGTNLQVPNRKNLLRATLADIKAINADDGTWNNNVYTSNSGQFVATVNTDSDGYITSISVNAPVNVTANRAIKIPVVGLSGNYKFSGGAGEKTDIYMWDVTMSARCKIWNGETSSSSSTSIEYNQLQIVENNTTEMRIRLLSGASAGTYVFYPMIVESYVTDPTFAPYIPSVESRIEDLESGLTAVSDDLRKRSIKYSGRAWPGDTLTFTNIGTDTSTAYHFVAIMGNNTGGGAAQEGYITCPNATNAVIWNKSGDWTASYSNNTLTITLPYSTYWVYRLEKAANMNG